MCTSLRASEFLIQGRACQSLPKCYLSLNMAFAAFIEYEREVENAWVELEFTGTHPSAISNVPINGFRVTVEDCTDCDSRLVAVVGCRFDDR